VIRSSDRILTTHVGSLYRSPQLLEMYRRKLNDEPCDEAEFQSLILQETKSAVRLQAEIGIDIPADGEMSRFSFRGYFHDRVSGLTFGPAGAYVNRSRDRTEFADFYAQAAPHYWMPVVGKPLPVPVCVGPITYNSEPALRDIANLKEAMKDFRFMQPFMPAQVAPSSTTAIRNEYYSTQEECNIAFVEALREEYKLLAASGLVVQLDDPFIAQEWEVYEPAISIKEYRKRAEERVALLNYSLEGVPEDMVRLHVCWGSWHGPHAHDLPLRDIVDILLKVKAQAYSIEAANPQHEHEWEVWKDVRLPDGKILIPGVVTHKSYVVEHPDLVAQRIVRYADLVGRENIIAAPDCGMGGRIHQQVGLAKLRVMVEGARRASDRLWRNAHRKSA